MCSSPQGVHASQTMLDDPALDSNRLPIRRLANEFERLRHTSLYKCILINSTSGIQVGSG